MSFYKPAFLLTSLKAEGWEADRKIDLKAHSPPKVSFLFFFLIRKEMHNSSCLCSHPPFCFCICLCLVSPPDLRDPTRSPCSEVIQELFLTIFKWGLVPGTRDRGVWVLRARIPSQPRNPEGFHITEQSQETWVCLSSVTSLLCNFEPNALPSLGSLPHCPKKGGVGLDDI